MLKKISAFPLAAFIAITSLARSVKEDERGLSGVVVAVLLILIAVLAVILIWKFLGDWINELWTRITDTSKTIT